LEATAYAFDSTTIDLCLSLFRWARFRRTKAAIKLHTLLDLRGPIPTFVHISDGKLHDVNALDELPIEPGAFYVMDRGYLDFARLHVIEQQKAFFVIRAKRGMRFVRLHSLPVDRQAGLRSDQVIQLTVYYSQKGYPDRLRRIRFFDTETQRFFIYLTNNFALPAMTIALLYKSRWQVELFFKWIKQNLHIKSFYGTSPNAVKTQVWIAIPIRIATSMFLALLLTCIHALAGIVLKRSQALLLDLSGLAGVVLATVLAGLSMFVSSRFLFGGLSFF